MRARAKEGTCLATLVRMAKPLCQSSPAPVPQNVPGTTTGVSGLADGGPYYDRWAEKEKEQVGAVPFFA